MERLRQKLAGLHSRAEEEADQWKQHHGRLMALLSNAQAILARLPVLSRPANYGVLAGVKGYVERLQAQQIGSLEGLLSKSQTTMASLQSSVLSLAKCARDAQRLVASQRPQLTQQQLTAHSGCEASLQSCIDGLAEVAQMYSDEYRLVEAAVPKFTVGTSQEELLAVTALLADQPNIQRTKIGDVLEKGRLTSAG